MITDTIATGAAITGCGVPIAAVLNTPAFDCEVGTTPQMSNRVANPFNMGIFSNLVQKALIDNSAKIIDHQGVIKLRKIWTNIILQQNHSVITMIAMQSMTADNSAKIIQR